MQHTELLAKVLATENITVQRAQTQTASFDIKNRVLTLPVWQNMNDKLEAMLILHEVGHALYSPEKYVEVARESKVMSSILNVVEDPRIERLMKVTYPGSRKDFAEGYRQIQEMDFLEICGKDVNDYGFLDRLNIYHKAGPISGVKFSKEEAVFVNRTNSIVTFEEAEALTRDIYSFMKAKSEEGDNEDYETIINIIESGDSDDEEFDEDGDGEGYDSYSAGASGGHGPGAFEEYEAQTMKALNSKVSSFAEGKAPIYIDLPSGYLASVIVPNKEIIGRIKGHFGEPTQDFINKFKQENGKKVSHIVSLFELKKAASVYALRSIRKTGVLDTNKVAQYKIKEDIFRRNIITPEGKNHGMVMLLDWSASMLSGSILRNSLNQVMQLVSFCRQVGVPYRVYAFCDPVKEHLDYKTPCSRVSLLELFSNEMTLKDHNFMIGAVRCGSLARSWSLRNTPLAPALVAMRTILKDFKATYKTDKLNFITFTDGGNTTSLIDRSWAYKDSTDVYAIDKNTKRHYKIFDVSGERKHARSNWRVMEVNSLYQVIKDEMGDGVTITSYFATNASARKLSDSLWYSGITGLDYETVQKHTAAFDKNGFAKIKGYGRDAIYVIKSSILQTQTVDLDSITPDMSTAKIASAIRGGRGGDRSKVMLEDFVTTIS